MHGTPQIVEVGSEVVYKVVGLSLAWYTTDCRSWIRRKHSGDILVDGR